MKLMMGYRDRTLGDYSYPLTPWNLEGDSWKFQRTRQVPDAKEAHLLVQADRKRGLEHEGGVVVLGLFPDRQLGSELLSPQKRGRVRAFQLLSQLARVEILPRLDRKVRMISGRCLDLEKIRLHDPCMLPT